MEKFEIHHESGYILDKNKNGLSKSAGIYIVYKCDYNSFNDSVNVKEVLYIGETGNIYGRHVTNTHEHYDDFIKYAGGKEHICYGEILLPNLSDDDRKMIEAAMIHVQKPVINDENDKKHYTKSASDIIMSGGPDCWKTKHFIHPFHKGDEIGMKSLFDYLNEIKNIGE